MTYENDCHPVHKRRKVVQAVLMETMAALISGGVIAGVANASEAHSGEMKAPASSSKQVELGKETRDWVNVNTHTPENISTGRLPQQGCVMSRTPIGAYWVSGGGGLPAAWGTNVDFVVHEGDSGVWVFVYQCMEGVGDNRPYVPRGSPSLPSEEDRDFAGQVMRGEIDLNEYQGAVITSARTRRR